MDCPSWFLNEILRITNTTRISSSESKQRHVYESELAENEIYFMNEFYSEHLKHFFEQLPEEYCRDYDKWSAITRSTKALCHNNSLDTQVEIKKCWVEWSETCAEKFHYENNLREWDSFRPTYCMFNTVIIRLNQDRKVKDQIDYRFYKSEVHNPLKGIDAIKNIKVVRDDKNKWVNMIYGNTPLKLSRQGQEKERQPMQDNKSKS